ncbi:TPA: hypothetical protein JK846_003650 [Escherichia coli]|nr:hypothetical protein [Escherichia coli]
MKKILAVTALALLLSSCAGSSVGLGAGTGFPGIGLGAGVSLPIGGDADKADEAYLKDIERLVKSHAKNPDAHKDQLCTVRVTADTDGMLMDVKRLEGDDGWCDAVMESFYSFNRLPKPSETMAPRLKRGLVMDLIG